MLTGTGFLRVAAFHTDSRQAGVIAQAIVTTLVEKGWEYVGGEVQIKAVDNVTLSRFPVRPNILLNIVMGFIIGAFGVIVFELFRAPRHHHEGGMGASDWLRHL